MTIHDQEVKRLLKLNDKKTTYKTVKLPCGHATVEIKKAKDQWIICPTCLNAFFLPWSLDLKFTKVGKYK